MPLPNRFFLLVWMVNKLHSGCETLSLVQAASSLDINHMISFGLIHHVSQVLYVKWWNPSILRNVWYCTWNKTFYPLNDTLRGGWALFQRWCDLKQIPCTHSNPFWCGSELFWPYACWLCSFPARPGSWWITMGQVFSKHLLCPRPVSRRGLGVLQTP